MKPLWQRPRGHILDALEKNHFEMIITCCNLSKTGRELAEQLLTLRGPELMQALRKLSGESLLGYVELRITALSPHEL